MMPHSLSFRPDRHSTTLCQRSRSFVRDLGVESWRPNSCFVLRPKHLVSDCCAARGNSCCLSSLAPIEHQAAGQSYESCNLAEVVDWCPHGLWVPGTTVLRSFELTPFRAAQNRDCSSKRCRDYVPPLTH